MLTCCLPPAGSLYRAQPLFRRVVALMRPGATALQGSWWSILFRKGWAHGQGLRLPALTETLRIADPGALAAFAYAPSNVVLGESFR